MSVVTEVERVPLKVSDRCDRCGAQAFASVVLKTGDLLFCGHHFSRYEVSLVSVALAVNDARTLIGGSSV